MGLGGVAIAVPPYVIHPKTAVLGRAGGVILSCEVAFAQTSVTGKVTSSDDGEPVVGASVRIIGSKTGTVTDIDGNFSLNVPADAKLEISYIGMNPQTVKASSNMNIVLTSDN